MSDLFLIGAAGTKAYRAALGAVSENISNANTDNFSRRVIRLRESSSSSGIAPLMTPQSNFGGVEVAGITRNNDPYLDAATRFTGGMLGSANARARWLADVETALNDTELGVGQRLNEFFSSVQRLAANPADATLRTNLLYNVEEVASAFNQSAEQLGTVISSIGDTAETEVAALNDAIASLAKINEGLRRVLPDTAAEAQLLDSRDHALSEISKRLNVDVSFADHGVAQVRYNGSVVLDDLNPTSFAVARNADGTLGLTHIGGNVTAPANGSLGGLFSSAAVAVEQLASLDMLANRFATDINAWHGQGVTDAGNPGGNLVSITAGAASLQTIALQITDIAAASTDGRLNGNLLNISSIRGTGGVESGWTALIAGHANLMTAAKAEQLSAENRDQQARASRAEVSGVDLDAEAADLLRYQQAYQAAARIIQVAREITQSILNIN